MSAAALRTDPVLLDVLPKRLKAVAEEKAAATLQTAFTVFVKRPLLRARLSERDEDALARCALSELPGLLDELTSALGLRPELAATGAVP